MVKGMFVVLAGERSHEMIPGKYPRKIPGCAVRPSEDLHDRLGIKPDTGNC